jgi:hypothetical protein
MFGSKSSFVAPQIDLDKLVDDLTMPVHLAFGDENTGSLVGEEERMTFLAKLRMGSATHYASAGHVLHAERRDAFAEDVKRFLKRGSA